MRLNFKLAAFFMALIGAALFVLGKGDLIALPAMRERLLAVCAVVMLFLVVVIVYALLVRRADRKAAAHEVGSAEIVDVAPTSQPAAPSDPFAGLRHILRGRYGMRWRYRQPWLLLTGHDSAIARLLPELTETGWLVTDDAVLLWSKAGDGDLPDEAWLKRLYRLRCRRPVDAVVLTVDGTAELPAPRRGIGALDVRLARITDTLRWAAPVFVLDVADSDPVEGVETPLTGCEFPRHAERETIEAALHAVRLQLANRGIAQLSRNARNLYAAKLSSRLDTRTAPLAGWIAGMFGGDADPAFGKRYRRQHVGGAFFAPYPAPVEGREKDTPSGAELSLWRHLGGVARTVAGRRVGWHPATVCSVVAFIALGLWTAGMLISALSNASEVQRTKQALHTLDAAPDSAARLRALLALQQRIDFYESRARQHSPLLSRFGMNRDRETLAALWHPYSRTSLGALVTPIRQNLEATLVDLGQMQTEQVDDQTSRIALAGHEALKTYLMLAEPDRADAAFMTPQLGHYWSTSANLRAGEKLDLSGRLLGFYARHLKSHPDWRIQPRQDLVNAARQTLLSVIGVKNSEDTVYKGVIDAVGNRYPDQTLASLAAGTDARGLLKASASVPGVFTRQAYEGAIEATIDEAAKRNEIANDWVLGGSSQRQAPEHSAASMKASLTSRYFADYADHWQGFMNALQWEPAPTLPSAIQQLKLMADARQSPVIALMKSIEYQGGAGALKTSLSDTLVDKAQQVFGGKADGPQTAKPDPAGPLGASFGPVLRIVAQGDVNRGGNSDLSLQRFMERVTTLRLKLQQISDSPDADARARQVAQALFQGKGSELADTQAYAQLIAASLGAQWAGLGDALFVRPVAQATQTVLQPAQASLNAAWRRTIVATWNRSFAGRYPFADTGNDASIPELARFLRPQGGLIGAFLGSQLAGVLELQGDQWEPAAAGSTAVTFDPDFLRAMNLLQRIAGHLLAQGEPQYRFDLRPVPTAGVTDTIFTLDGQSLHYYNQQETWQPLTWPSNRTQGLGTRLQWQTDTAGTNKQFEFGGRWGLVRMLERARVQPVDGATFLLTWQAAPDTRAPGAARPTSAVSAASATKVSNADDEEGDEATAAADPADSLTAQGPLTPASMTLTYPLSFMLRTEVGKGPLELLALRQFVLPPRIFAVNAPYAGKSVRKSARTDGPPPLPRAMLDAAKHADTPLPGGLRPL
ncbi:type VI secretion protein VasK [Burkholderia stagnalis]|uniref:ImcF-related family protein n=1 Tax=Burkholderia stagnalis TaxID=1503054 RepID=UPI0007553425|nr:ImcF-related family protein [Burkholderia stagnalis]KVD93237.1 type VI secretion protein VasK [Burkholderia stagnalis]